MKNNIIKITENKLYQIIKESVEKILNEKLNNNEELYNSIGNSHYSYYNKCNQMEADEVQEITRWDEYSENDYCIDDAYFNNGIYIIPTELFLKATKGEYQPSPNLIDYCAYNEIMDVLFCYTKKDIHYFYT